MKKQQLYRAQHSLNDESLLQNKISCHQLPINLIDKLVPWQLSLARISSFLSSFSIPPVVCDLGCGDFNIGRQLVKYSSNYIGVDIVNDLILHNKNIFNQKQLEFRCLDIANDPIPAGDCAIIRQVFQHLSNDEVQQILKKLYQFKFVIITEHIPKHNFIPNIDILSGQGIRLKKNSGLDVTSAPFNFKVIDKKQLLKLNVIAKDELIVTTLYQMF